MKPFKLTLGVVLMILSFALTIVILAFSLRMSSGVDEVLQSFGLPRGYASGLTIGFVALGTLIVAAIVALIIVFAAYTVIHSEG